MTRTEQERIVADLLNEYHNKAIIAVYLPDAGEGETFRGHPVRPGNIGIGISGNDTKEES